MNSPRTTWFAIAAAIGFYLWDLVSVPWWVNVLGKCLVIIGSTGAGVSAADAKKVKEHGAEIEQLKTDTKTASAP